MDTVYELQVIHNSVMIVDKIATPTEVIEAHIAQLNNDVIVQLLAIKIEVGRHQILIDEPITGRQYENYRIYGVRLSEEVRGRVIIEFKWRDIILFRDVAWRD